MAMKVRKVSTSKLDDLFVREAWIESPPSSFPMKRNFPTIDGLTDLRPPSIKLPQNCSVLAPSGSSSSSFSAETDDEYGYYDDFHDEPTPSMDENCYNVCMSKKSSSNNPNLVTPYTSAKSLAHSPIAQKIISRDVSSVVCFLGDLHADVSCRSFESTGPASTKVNVCIVMDGIRLVQKFFLSEVAEYKLRILIDDREFIAWKSFCDFQSLGEACRIHMDRIRGKGKHNLTNTVQSWDAVLSHRCWWRRPNQIDFIKEESRLLEDFMKHLLFEIPCIEMLVEFVVS